MSQSNNLKKIWSFTLPGRHVLGKNAQFETLSYVKEFSSLSSSMKKVYGLLETRINDIFFLDRRITRCQILVRIRLGYLETDMTTDLQESEQSTRSLNDLIITRVPLEYAKNT